MGFSYYMPDIISVALITGAAALIPQGFIFWQNLRQAREAGHDRRTTSVRRACEGLYTTVSDLRTQIRTNYDYHGQEMRERLEKVWRYAGEADKQAVHIELLADGDLAGTARQLAAAAAKAAAAAAEKTDLDMNRCVALPDLSELVTQANAFREQAAAYIGG
jgi:undecaprenyl pyrophosphate synthase